MSLLARTEASPDVRLSSPPTGLWKELVSAPLSSLRSVLDREKVPQASDVEEWIRALRREKERDPCLANQYEERDGMTALQLFFDFLKELHFTNDYIMDEKDSSLIRKGLLSLMHECPSEFVRSKDNFQRTVFHYLAWANVYPDLLQFFLQEVHHILAVDEGYDSDALQNVIQMKDCKSKTALDYALESKTKAVSENILLLLKYGARFDDEKLMTSDVNDLDSLLYEVAQTIAYRDNPEDLCIKLVAHLREQGEKHKYDGTKDRFMTVSQELEDLTVAMLGDANSDRETFHLVNRDHVNLAKKRGLKKYLASGGAQQYVNCKWYGLDPSEKSSKETIPFTRDLLLGERGGIFLHSRLTRAVVTGLRWYHYAWLVVLFYVENLLYLLSLSLLSNRLRLLHIPAIAYGAQTFMFFLFVILLLFRVDMYHNIAMELSRKSMIIEGLVLCFCFGYILEKFIDVALWIKRQRHQNQTVDDAKGKMSIVLKWENIPLVTGYIIEALLALSLLGFVVADSIVLESQSRHNSTCSSKALKANSSFFCNVLIASLILIGFAATFACLNLLIIFRLHSSLGPLQVAFWSLGKDVMYFLVMLLTFGLAFAAVMTSTFQAALIQEPSLARENGHQASLFSSVVSLFWALFGLIELNDFQTSAGGETTLLLIFVAVWLLLAAVILLNMLIGLVTIIFQNIYENAEREWKYTRAIVIMDLEPGRVFPLPFGWFCVLMGVLLNGLSSRMFRDKDSVTAETFLGVELDQKEEIDGTAVENIQNRVKQRIREAKGKSPCIRTDIDEVVDRIEGLERRLESMQSNLREAFEEMFSMLNQSLSKSSQETSKDAQSNSHAEASLHRLPTFSYKRPTNETSSLALVKRIVPSLQVYPYDHRRKSTKKPKQKVSFPTIPRRLPTDQGLECGRNRSVTTNT